MSAQEANVEPQQPKTFHDLPAELKNRVYELALLGDKCGTLQVIRDYRRKGTHFKLFALGKPDHLGLNPNLLAVSKTIRHEAAGVLYGAKPILFELDVLSDFLRTNAAARKHIRHIKLRIPEQYSTSWFGHDQVWKHEYKRNTLWCLMSMESLSVIELTGIYNAVNIGPDSPSTWSASHAVLLALDFRASVECAIAHRSHALSTPQSVRDVFKLSLQPDGLFWTRERRISEREVQRRQQGIEDFSAEVYKQLEAVVSTEVGASPAARN